MNAYKPRGLLPIDVIENNATMLAAPAEKNGTEMLHQCGTSISEPAQMMGALLQA
ncbi:MAG: hypothetical protein QXQ57_05960 [Sulfolobales archaeon]